MFAQPFSTLSDSLSWKSLFFILAYPFIFSLSVGVEYTPLFEGDSFDILAILTILAPLFFLLIEAIKGQKRGATLSSLSFLSLGLQIILFGLLLNGLYLHPSRGILMSLIFLGHIFFEVKSTSTRSGWDHLKVHKEIPFIYFVYLALILLTKPQIIQQETLFYFIINLMGASLFSAMIPALKLCQNESSWPKYARRFLIVLIGAAYMAENGVDLPFVLGDSIQLFLLALNTVGVLWFIQKNWSVIIHKLENLISHQSPEVVILFYFSGLAFLGTVFMTWDSRLSPINSLFTAMSAVSITGLSVIDISTHLNPLSQVFLLILIQMGALGITSLSAWIFFLLRSKKLDLNHEDTLYSVSGYKKNVDIKLLFQRILSYFLVMEIMGAVLLLPFFISEELSFLSSLWRALFTSVSAFSNAGFALTSNSLVSFQQSPGLLFVISLLIIAGGFAPLMASSLPQKLKQGALNLQDKLSLTTTGLLLVFGFVYLLLAEWNYSLSPLSFSEKIVNAWFQSVTTRTAGFNSIPLENAQPVSHLIIMILMFIGGNPGSVAGGIKTVTFAILVLAAVNALKERQETRCFYRVIPTRTIFKALLITFVGFILHLFVFFVLSLTQNIPPIPLLFETFSALGTVGLSLGATQQLDEVGKIIIVLSMLAGRVGPLTFLLLILKTRKERDYQVPREDVSLT